MLMQYHVQAWRVCWQQLRRAKMASLMTVLVIGLALALPSSLLMVLQNVKLVGAGLEHGRQISLYLQSDLTQQQIESALTEIRQLPAVASVNYISPEQGLKDLQSFIDVHQVLDDLPKNPLPPVIEVFPMPNIDNEQAMNNLTLQLRQIPEVSSAKMDMQWLARFSSIVALAQRATWLLLGLFSLAVLLVVSNTIRMSTQHRHHEIEVLKMIGATNAYVRLPFLYSGLIVGLAGGAVAWCLNGLLVLSLKAPVQALAALYDSVYQILGLSPVNGAILLIFSAILGLIGARFAVNRHIALIEPR